jgi:hypothetical protein
MNGSTYGVLRLTLPSSHIEPGVYRIQLTLVRLLAMFTDTY